MKARRIDRRIKQSEMASAMGVTQSRVSQMESGAEWSALHVWTACNILECRPSDLMDEIPPVEIESAVVQAIRSRDYVAAMGVLVAVLAKEK